MLVARIDGRSVADSGGANKLYCARPPATKRVPRDGAGDWEESFGDFHYSVRSTFQLSPTTYPSRTRPGDAVAAAVESADNELRSHAPDVTNKPQRSTEENSGSGQ